MYNRDLYVQNVFLCTIKIDVYDVFLHLINIIIFQLQ